MEASLIKKIDSLARAAHSWVRQQSYEQRFVGMPLTQSEECALAAGFIAGLKVRMDLEDDETTMLAYVYVLLAGDSTWAAEIADELGRELEREFDQQLVSEHGFKHGLQAAHRMLESAPGLTSDDTTEFGNVQFN